MPSSSIKTKKNSSSTEELFSKRCVPDSNGCNWFCRPVTKPLIQRTLWFVVQNKFNPCFSKNSSHFRFASAKLLHFYILTNIYTSFFH